MILFKSIYPFVSGLLSFFSSCYKGFFILILAFIAQSGLAQSYFFYEFKVGYPQKDSATCYVFLNIAPGGTAEGRLRYIEPVTGADCLYQLELADTDSTLADISKPDSILYLNLIADPINMQSNFDGGLDPDIILPRFGFKKNSPHPDSLYYPFEVGYRFYGRVTLPDQYYIPSSLQIFSLNEGNLSADVVNKFYTSDEDLYQFLFKTDTRSIPFRNKDSKMYLICVAATDDEIIGVTAKRDMNNITNLYSNLAKQIGIPFGLTEISGSNFSKENVEKAIMALQPTSKDIVIFYFSGHGFRFSSDFSRYPRMLFRTDSLQRREEINLGQEDVYERLIQKGAKVNLVISDCCNEDVGPSARFGRNSLTTRSIGFGRAKLNVKNVEALFFPQNRNNMIITSADKNQLASGNPALGGYFTFSFMSELERNLYTILPADAWVKILADTREATRKLALRAVCDKTTRARCIQTPFFR